MVVCKCKKATKLYCFVHKVPVCGECICAPDDQICVIRTYSEWVIDGEYNWPPKCCHCQVVLDEETGSQTTQLGCLHLIHTSCLVSHIKSFPSHTAPAGYDCPGCSTSVLAGNRSVPSLSAKRAPISQNPNRKAMAAKPQQNAFCDITNQRNGSESGPQASGLSSKPSVPCASVRQMTCSLCGDKGHNRSSCGRVPCASVRQMSCSLCGDKGHNRRSCGRRQPENHGSISLGESSGSSANVGSYSTVDQGCVTSVQVQVEKMERAGTLAKNVNRPVWRY